MHVNIRAYSSTAEQSAHNALVAGSNPAGPTLYSIRVKLKFSPLYRVPSKRAPHDNYAHWVIHPLPYLDLSLNLERIARDFIPVSGD